MFLHHQLVTFVDVLRGDTIGGFANALPLAVVGEAGAAYRRKRSAIAPCQGAVARPVGRNTKVRIAVIGGYTVNGAGNQGVTIRPAICPRVGAGGGTRRTGGVRMVSALGDITLRIVGVQHRLAVDFVVDTDQLRCGVIEIPDLSAVAAIGLTVLITVNIAVIVIEVPSTVGNGVAGTVGDLPDLGAGGAGFCTGLVIILGKSDVVAARPLLFGQPSKGVKGILFVDLGTAAGDGNMRCLPEFVVRKSCAPGVAVGDPLERKDRERPLVLSIVLGYFYGLHGVLMGVLISLLIVVLGWKPIWLFRNGFKITLWRYVKIYIAHVFIGILSWYLVARLYGFANDLLIPNVPFIITAIILSAVFVCILSVMTLLVNPQIMVRVKLLFNIRNVYGK